MLFFTTANVTETAKKYGLANNANFVGVQARYYWRDLEPRRDEYYFDKLDADVAYLSSIKKKLFIQIQDINWSKGKLGFPDYLISSEFGDGYYINNHGVSIPKKYLPSVAGRLQELIRVLGERYDNNPHVVGVTLEETALGIDGGATNANDYTPDLWESALTGYIDTMKKYWPETPKILYINWFSGCTVDNTYPCLARVAQYAVKEGVGLGGPDVNVAEPTMPGYRNYPLAYGKVPLATAVQWSNYRKTNPATGGQVTAEEIMRFGVDTLKLNMMFWITRDDEPTYHFSSDVLPMLQRTGAPINKELYTP